MSCLTHSNIEAELIHEYCKLENILTVALNVSILCSAKAMTAFTHMALSFVTCKSNQHSLNDFFLNDNLSFKVDYCVESSIIKMINVELRNLECYMDWFLSLICKNYILKHFVKTVEPTSLKFCTIIELISLHLEYTIAQVKYANFYYAHAQTIVC